LALVSVTPPAGPAGASAVATIELEAASAGAPGMGAGVTSSNGTTGTDATT
jgi:hypothetical protein